MLAYLVGENDREVSWVGIDSRPNEARHCKLQHLCGERDTLYSRLCARVCPAHGIIGLSDAVCTGRGGEGEGNGEGTHGI